MLNRIVAIDVETTGLSHGTDKITEVGMVKYENGIEIAHYSQLINPGVNIPDNIVTITGITNEMVKDAPYIDECIKEIIEFIDGYSIIGHSVMFDIRFLTKAAVNAGLVLKGYGLDTLKIARKLLVDAPNKKLDYLCSFYGIEDEEHHRAENDARAAAKLYMILSDRYEDANKECFEPYELSYKVKKESPATQRQIAGLKKLLEYHNLKVNYDIEHLTKNEVSRKMDKIILQYGRPL